MQKELKINQFKTIKIIFYNENKYLFVGTDIKNYYLILTKNIIISKKENCIFLDYNETAVKDIEFFFKNLKIKIFKKKLILKGLGIKARLISDNKVLELKLGYSHLITIILDAKIDVIINKNIITFESYDLNFLGNFVSEIKNYKVPDSYKGKGIWLKNEILKLKTVKKT